MAKELTGLWICCGTSKYATGNSPQEAYNRYYEMILREGLTDNPLPVTACSIYLATQAFVSC